MKSRQYSSKIVEALKAKYTAEAEVAKANIQVYISNPVGIGEHPDLVGAMDTEVEKLAHAEEKLATIKKLQKSLS